MFEIGNQYTRRDVFRIIGIPEDTWGGNWFTGYNVHDGAFYIFANVGSTGRTGHDYPNRWEGSRLRWFAKSGTRLEQPQIQQMLDRHATVHVFWRGDNDRPFTYAGLAHHTDVVDTSPVEVLWEFTPTPLNDEYRSADELVGAVFLEGAIRSVTVNAFERNASARRACLDFHGYRCRVCDMSFEERYGELGRGFIHVHHLVPLATTHGEYSLDPLVDLAPVCPNCHAMLHRTDPPMSIEQLRSSLRGVAVSTRNQSQF